MPPADQSRDLVQFEDFELIIPTAELKASDGKVIRLSEQPLRILIALLERPGELVLREDLRKRLWPNDTVVEFEHSISAAMNRLRQALGDSAENPRFIETLARKGYRWKTPVKWVALEAPASPQSPLKPVDGNLIGKKVSHYRVLEILGGGGMGVVYKAEDIKLGRRVALKFLPEELADDPSSMQRFEREARAASTLNHPNICTIHEVEEHEGRHFIVMELLEGETLRDMISGSNPDYAGGSQPLPVTKCVDLALQIAQGLAAAHERGIIHRDIKPANIFLTRDGRVKILDFGLAKLQDLELPEEEPGATRQEKAQQPSSPQLTLTRTGLAIGTAGYMSPEQVRGERLDARTDLFSFGLVLYEMATRTRAFTGETVPLLHAAILENVPEPVRELNPGIPAKLARIIDRALEKDRADRYQTASEMHRDLQNVRRETSDKRSWWKSASIAVAAILLVAAAISWVTHRLASPHNQREFRQHQLTVNSTENPVTGGAISPDGKYLAYTDLDGIHLKLVESGESQLMSPPKIFQGRSLNWEIGSWLPDSAHFLALAEPPREAVTMWKISVAGDQQSKIAEGANPWGVSPDGSLLAITRRNDHEVWLIDPDGGHARKVWDGGDTSSFRVLQFSPDGQRLVYIRNTQVKGANASQIESRDLNGGAPIVMLPSAGAHEISQLELGFQDLTWLPDNRLIYVGGEPDIHGTSCNLWQAQLDGHTKKFIAGPERFTNWAGFCVTMLSRTTDGTRLSFARSSDLLTVYRADFDSTKIQISTPKKLTFTDDMSSPTGWTPDGSAVLIRSNREGTWGIYKQPLAGGPAESVVTKLKGVSWSTPVSPDGKWLIYAYNDATGSIPPVHIMRVPLSGGPSQEIAKLEGGEVRCPVAGNASCVVAETTPDGKHIVFSLFDPMRGKSHELTRFTDEHADELGWDLSPDGAQVVLFRDFAAGFQVLTLGSAGTVRVVQTENGAQLRNLSWAADGRGFFASAPTQHGAELIHVDLQGKSRHLWGLTGYNIFLAGRPSPDGHHLAIQGSAATSNMWMIENF